MKKILFLILSFIFTVNIYGQQINTISTRCPSPDQLSYSRLIALADGNINAIPCPSGNFQINGVNLPSPATIITGTGTANFIPRFTSAQVLANTPFSWNGTLYAFNNTALNSEITFDFTPSATGAFRFGDYTTTATSYFTQNYNTNESVLRSTSRTDFNLTTDTVSARLDNALGTFNLRNAGNTANFEFDFNAENLTANGWNNLTLEALTQARIGDYDGNVNNTHLEISVTGKAFFFRSDGTGIFNTSAIGTFAYNRTITPAGTTGNQTIDKPAGTVNLAAGASSITVTNSTVTANSIIIPVARTNDATCAVKNYVAGVGSFVINMTAACTAETSVGFLVTN